MACSYSRNLPHSFAAPSKPAELNLEQASVAGLLPASEQAFLIGFLPALKQESAQSSAPANLALVLLLGYVTDVGSLAGSSLLTITPCSQPMEILGLVV